MKPRARRTNRTLTPIALIASVALAMSGCGATDQETGEEVASDSGFDYGASQEEVDAILENLEPVTLNYQTISTSPNAQNAESPLAFKEAVEERSGGKITIELVWGPAIAGYTDLVDALVDGRVDLATALPIYEPDRFPTFTAATSALSGLPTSPVVGETTYDAIAAEFGSRSEGIRTEFEDEGVVPIIPFMPAATYYGACNEPAPAAEDWLGSQVRVASTAHHAIMDSIGASPVSLQTGEEFDALQRGTIDCTLSHINTDVNAGVMEVAPYIHYTSGENSLPGRTTPAELAGSSFKNLPLAYQQIIFDTHWVTSRASQIDVRISGQKLAVEQARDAGGDVIPMEDELDQLIGQANEELSQEIRNEGLLSDELLDSLPELSEKWQHIISDELGYEDGGTIEDIDEWWEPGSVDFTGLTEAIYTEVGLQHRPS